MDEKKKKSLNYKTFLIAGFCFMGAGAIFLIAVNTGIGAALLGLGAAWTVIGAKHSKDNK